MASYTLVQRQSWPAGEMRNVLHRTGCQDIPKEQMTAYPEIWLDIIEAESPEAAEVEAIARDLTFEEDTRIMPCCKSKTRKDAR